MMMHDETPRPTPPQPKQRRFKKSLDRSTAIGLGVLIAMISFVLGNRLAGGTVDLAALTSNQNDTTTGLPADLDYSEVEQVYDELRQNYDGELDVDRLLDGLKEGLAQATGDPYTVYLSAEESEAFLDNLNGTFTGIGAELGIENEQLIIVAPLRGFPAEKAGLRPQDVITQINGEDVFGIKVEEAVSKIRGEKGTEVTLTVFRDGQLFDVTIVRDEIIVPSVEAEIVDGIGILRISRFAEDTVRLSRQAANDFAGANVRGVVVDLRNNSGGFLQGAVEVASIWMDGGVVVEQRRGGESVDIQRADSGAILDDVPTVVLINEGSASAAEIVAGALQDSGVATLVGQTSFGKGSVQQLEKISSGGTLKVTVARWFTPNGNNIDEAGITPDELVEITEEDITAERDPQLDRALELL
jgi:carboxyl-terminal processing protease